MTRAELNSPVAENVRKLISERGLKQNFIAEKAGFAPSAFCACLNGRRLIMPCEIPLIANAIGVDPNLLFQK